MFASTIREIKLGRKKQQALISLVCMAVPLLCMCVGVVVEERQGEEIQEREKREERKEGLQ